jgi:hypothetical protein
MPCYQFWKIKVLGYFFRFFYLFFLQIIFMNSFMSLVIFFKIIVNLNVIFLLQDKQMKGNRSGKYMSNLGLLSLIYGKKVLAMMINKMNYELMLTYDTPSYMFNVYKNQLSRQTGSRNLTGPKTFPTIWHTYMKLVTKYQISAINSCWEKCDEKYLGMDGRTAGV